MLFRSSQSGGTTNLAETYTYAANSNQLLAVANGGTTRSLAYSPTGNVATDNRGSGTALSFTYDLRDRMVQVANQNQPLAAYAYNFLGQRAAKTTPSAVTHFLYDRAGHLLAESNGATGAAQTEYIWLGDMPLALVTGGNLYFIHPDHLGTPQKATDASQALAWDAVLRPFGQTEQQTFPSLTNLRFPGQYLDVETGLAQNWFRDYDPSIGRYIESDPAGLRAGPNTYVYALSHPNNFIDPWGLEVTMTCRPLELVGTLGLSKPAHCGDFVWHWETDPCTGKKKKVIDAQFSLPGGQRKPAETKPNNPSYLHDRDAFYNPGDNNTNYDIPPPPGMSQSDFDKAVTDKGNEYVQGPYSLLGPNSNTAADHIISSQGGAVPDVPGAVGQHSPSFPSYPPPRP